MKWNTGNSVYAHSVVDNLKLYRKHNIVGCLI